jgi:hypothetical protein
LDLRLELGPLRLGRAGLDLVVDLMNATDQEDGIRDNALLLLEIGPRLERSPAPPSPFRM